MHGMAGGHISIYRPEKNCWRIGQAHYVSVLVDSANYYCALHQSISKARESIFILGWDIDSRIELLRGDDARNAEGGVTFFDLICRKAEENPDLQIYLNKWNYSYFFMKQREPFWLRKWKKCGLSNIHVCLDGVIPIGACHHQKIVVVDDEVAFWGGMDVALGRWDKRQHHTENPCRTDPGGLPNPQKRHKFGPYHDIQAVVAGPVVTEFSQLTRVRWNIACDVDPLPVRPYNIRGLPQSWPQKFLPQFENVTMAIARTIPPRRRDRAVYEVLELFLDEIAQAESFVYIENQYLSCTRIARALNKRLQEKPGLRLLAISCYRPQGTMERKVMWAGRVRFRDILEQGETAGRVVLAHPVSCEHGTEEPVHIHSKIMIIDDKFLHLGSSNLADRSMGLDTEFDVSILGADEKSRETIEAVRNDLIREHCGREVSDIQEIIISGKPVSTFIEEIPTSRQHLRRIDDEQYRHEKFVGLARLFGDPVRPLVTWFWIRHPFYRKREYNLPVRPALVALMILTIITALSLIWLYTPLAGYANIGGAAELLGKLSDSPLSVLWAVAFYALGGTCFFPVTVMTAATVIVFGPFKGVAISFAGAVLGGVIGFSIGRAIGEKRLSAIFSERIIKITNKIKGAGVTGVALIRMVPAAPFPVVNMAFGVAGVSMAEFMMGTIIGLAPGKIALAFAGSGIFKILENPSPQNILYLGAGLVAWLAVIAISHKIARRRLEKRKRRV